MPDGDEIPVQDELGQLLALARFLPPLEEEDDRRAEEGHDLGQAVPGPAGRPDEGLADGLVDPGDLRLLVDGQEERAARLEDADELGDRPERIGGVVDRAPGPDDVEGGVGIGEVEHVLPLEAGVRRARTSP